MDGDVRGNFKEHEKKTWSKYMNFLVKNGGAPPTKAKIKMISQKTTKGVHIYTISISRSTTWFSVP